MVRCSCGLLMGTHTVRANASKGRTYHYYFCQTRRGRTGPCEQRMIRGDELEPAVWELVSDLLKDPEKLEELKHTKALAQAELANLSERRRRVEELTRDKETVLALRSEAVLRGLDNLSPEEKSEVYKLLKLEVTPTPEGMEVSGALLYSESLPFEKASRLPPFSET